VQILSNDSCLSYHEEAKDAAQHRIWTFYETINFIILFPERIESMFYYNRLAAFFSFLLIVSLCFVSCAEKKEGKVIVTEQEFSIRQDAEFNWVINATGKIRNVGDVDVKKVVVTGYCRSCSEMLVAGQWFVSGTDKRSEQKDIISYLTTGGEEEFSFEEVAFYFNQSGQAPESMPDKMEIVIESFETVAE